MAPSYFSPLHISYQLNLTSNIYIQLSVTPNEMDMICVYVLLWQNS